MFIRHNWLRKHGRLHFASDDDDGLSALVASYCLRDLRPFNPRSKNDGYPKGSDVNSHNGVGSVGT